MQRGIPETPSLLYCREKLFLLRDGGVLTCLESSTGKEFFRERIGAPGQYTASPIAAADKLITASVRGVVTVIQIENNLKVLARNNFGEKIFATPTIGDNTLYLRTIRQLYALSE
jgi:outer membrane protein assembly factor BamB